MEHHRSPPFDRPSQVFHGVRFVLLGFYPINKNQVSRILVDNGGVDAGQYGPDCTHVIVDKLAYDDPVCIAARRDGKILVTGLWVDHSFDVGAPVDSTSVMYKPPRDLNGIPGAKSLVICLTGYQREDREDIMTMVELMGAQFSKPLIANKVTHLICYKFEGEKYLLAKKMKRIKLINHQWLEDCLKAWEIVSEADYTKSGYELETEAEAKDSEEEPEGITARCNEGKIASPHHSLLLKQEVSNTLLNASASKLSSSAQDTVTVTMKNTSEQLPSLHEINSKNQVMLGFSNSENIIDGKCEPSNLSEGTVSGSTAQKAVAASTVANKSPSNEARGIISANYSKKDSIRTTPPTTVMKSNTSSARRLNKLNLSDALNMSSSTVQKANDGSATAFCPEDEQKGSSVGKRKMEISCGSSKLQKPTHNDDLESAFQELKKDSPAKKSTRLSLGSDILDMNDGASTSPAKKLSNISGRTSTSSKGKSITCDVPISKTSLSKIVDDEDLDAVQRPQNAYKETTGFDNRDGEVENAMQALEKSSPSVVQKPLKEYKETSFTTRFDNRDVGMVENVMQGLEKSSPSAADHDLQKSSTLNLEINEQGSGSNLKPVKRKSLGKKFSAPKLSKKNTVNQKGSIFLKNSEPRNDATTSVVDFQGVDDDENLYKYQEIEKVPLIAKSGTEIEGNDGLQIDNAIGDKSLCMDDETEPPEDKEEACKEKHEDGGPENTVDNIMEEKAAEGDLHDVNQSNEDLATEKASRGKTRKGKKKTSLSVKDLIDKKAAKENELVRDNNNEKPEIREEATPNQTRGTKRNVNDMGEKSTEVKIAEGVCIDLECEIKEKDDDDGANMDSGNVVKTKETKRNKRPSGKTKKAAKEKELVGNNNNETPEFREEATPNRARGTKRNVNDMFEKSTEVKITEGVYHDLEHKNKEKAGDDDADMDSGIVVNTKENKRNKRPLGKKAGKEEELVHDNNNEQPEIIEEATPNRARGTKRNVNDMVEKSTEVKIAEGVCHDLEHKNEEKDGDDGADRDSEIVVNKKDSKRNKRSLGKTKKDAALSVKEVKAANKKGKTTSGQAVKASDLEAQKENMQIPFDDQTSSDKQDSKPTKNFPKKIDKSDSDISKDEPMWFILTGHQLQRRVFQQIIRRLKGRVCRVSHQWSYQATHFIVPDPIRRTEKFFAAAASGRWILKTDYLSASNQAGRFLTEEPYEWYKNGLSEDGQVSLEAPRKWRLLKEKTGHGAFYGMRIVIYGECIAPSLDTLKRAVKAGDGTILATSPPYTRFLNTGVDFAVVSPGMPHVDVWVQEFIRHEIPCVSVDYLVEHVCKPGYPLEKHVLYNTHVWAERSYNNLKKRLNEQITEPRTPDSNDVACEVCGSRDRGEEMLICGVEDGSSGCGVGTHIDCCDPPLEDVPEEDWFCPKCSDKSKNSKTKKNSKRKGSAGRAK